MVTVRRAFVVLVSLTGAIFGLPLGAAPARAEEEEAFLMDFFKRRRPAGLKLKPRFPYPYDYLYAAFLGSLPEVEEERGPKDSKNFAPLEAKPGSPEEALRDLVMAWRDGRPELIRRHLDPRTPIACYVRGAYSHLLSPEEFLSFTRIALSRLKTLSLRFGRPVQVSEGKFSATGVHIFIDPEGKKRSVAIEVAFVKVGDAWIVKSINYGPEEGKRKKGKCVISSLIFGPDSEEVATLIAFRDRCLSRCRLGRGMVVLYYWLAGTISGLVEKGGPLVRGLTCSFLRPAVLLARWALKGAEDPPPTGPNLGSV